MGLLKNGSLVIRAETLRNAMLIVRLQSAGMVIGMRMQEKSVTQGTPMTRAGVIAVASVKRILSGVKRWVNTDNVKMMSCSFARMVIITI